MLVVLMLLSGVIGCSKSSEKKLSGEKIDDKQTISNISENNVQNQESNENYETSLKKRIEDIQKEVQPGLDSGVTADMNNAIQKLGDSWETEMKKVYELLLSELSGSEKEKLQKEQEEWIKKVKKDVEKKTEESEGGTISGTLGGNAWASGIEERTLELAKRYDKIHKK